MKLDLRKICQKTDGGSTIILAFHKHQQTVLSHQMALAGAKLIQMS